MTTSSSLFSAHLESRDGADVVVLLGELDIDSAPELTSLLASVVENGPAEVKVECSGLSFIDSSGLSVLIAAQKRLNDRGARLVVRAPRPNVLRVIDITHLGEYLNVEDAEGRRAPDPSQSPT